MSQVFEVLHYILYRLWHLIKRQCSREKSPTRSLDKSSSLNHCHAVCYRHCRESQERNFMTECHEDRHCHCHAASCHAMDSRDGMSHSDSVKEMEEETDRMLNLTLKTRRAVKRSKSWNDNESRCKERQGQTLCTNCDPGPSVNCDSGPSVKTFQNALITIQHLLEDCDLSHLP